MSAAQFSALKPQFDSKGVTMVGIGVEKLGYEDFVRGGFFEGRLFIDEQRAIYQALHCRTNTWRNFWGLCGGQILSLYRRSQKLNIENNLAGETTQLGGTFCLGPGDGGLIYGHYQTPSDFEPDLVALLRALRLEVPEHYVQQDAVRLASSSGK